ncbi:MAG: HlyD family efflux transporter periplasmic adaptor subunit [Leptolyngbyaceae bacterium]|nr:HlyD family efflux transporter periplasmic adaptor subunit [Leptolyngbyaceae bacterium]
MNDQPRSNSTNGSSNSPNGNGSSMGAKLAAARGGVGLQTPDAASGVEKQPPSGNEMAPQNAFDQPIILRQPSYWSRAIMIGIMGVTSFSLLAAFLFKVDEAIPATGKLEPEGAVQEVQAPAGGVVEEILVEDGDRVQQGETLIRLDPKVSEAELASLVAIYESTLRENQFYNAELNNQQLPTPEEMAQLDILPFYANLTLELRELKQREVVFRNYIGYLEQLGVQPVRPAYAGELQELSFAVWQQYFQISQQIRGSELQLQQIEGRINIEQSRIEVAEQSRQIEADIVTRIEPLVEEDGALAPIQLERQKSELLARENELGARYSELQSLAQQRSALTADLLAAREQQRGVVATAKAEGRSQLNNIVDRKQQITSDLNNRIIENNNRLAELEAQIQQAQTQLEYQEIISPIDGVVFDVQPQVQGLVNPNAAEPVLKVVPGDALVAQVFLTNQDVGFVLKAMEEKALSEEYDLQVISASSTDELPSEGNNRVAVAKIDDEYHVRIFDHLGEIVFDQGKQGSLFSQSLTDDLNLALNRSVDEETEIRLIREVTNAVEYPLGVQVDVRIDSFPFNEFRDVKGEVIWVGDDALPPDQVYNFFRFPAKIRLEQQFIAVDGAPVNLQSGMGVNVNIKTRKRRIITFFTDLFTRKVEKVREL